MRFRRSLVAVLVTAAVSAACGGGGGDDATGGEDADPVEVVAASSARTLAAGSSRMALVAETEVGGRRVTVSADGVFDYEDRRGRLTMDLGRLGVPGASGTAEIVLLGTVFYMKFPAVAASAGEPGKEWVKVDLAQAASAGGVDPSGLAGVGSNDPSAFVAMLRGASDDLRRVGSESLRGEATTHYRGTFDLLEALERAPASARVALQKAVDQLGSPRVPMDVWIDDDGRLRKLVQTVTVPVATPAATATSTTVTVELFDFGTPVEVTAPPAHLVADMTSTPRTAPAPTSTAPAAPAG